ncbi:hypothetical protein D3C80_1719330 [compost metagenome]
MRVARVIVEHDHAAIGVHQCAVELVIDPGRVFLLRCTELDDTAVVIHSHEVFVPVLAETSDGVLGPLEDSRACRSGRDADGLQIVRQGDNDRIRPLVCDRCVYLARFNLDRGLRGFRLGLECVQQSAVPR